MSQDIHEQVDAHAHWAAESQVPTGAVAYLNMLPFFFGNSSVKLYETPALLNADLARGLIATGCSSLVAGFENNLRPLVPLYGVAAELFVESVFIEPLFSTLSPGRQIRQELSQELIQKWEGILETNNGLYEKHLKTRSENTEGLKESQTPDLCSRSKEEHLVTIYTTGASAQSLWLVETLFQLQNLKTQIVNLSPRWLTCSASEIYEGLGLGNSLACLLVIGDPALRRRFQMPVSCEVSRIDVATMWKDFCGLPCIFAAWFTALSRESPSVQIALENIEEKTNMWLGLQAAEKLFHAGHFLQERGQEDLYELLGADRLLSYLENLQFKLGSSDYLKSIQVMHDLYSQMRRPVAQSTIHSPEEGQFRPLCVPENWYLQVARP